MISTLEGSVGLVFFTFGSVLSSVPGSLMRERLAVTFLETSVDFSSRLGGFTGSEKVERVSYVTNVYECLMLNCVQFWVNSQYLITENHQLPGVAANMSSELSLSLVAAASGVLGGFSPSLTAASSSNICCIWVAKGLVTNQLSFFV